MKYFYLLALSIILINGHSFSQANFTTGKITATIKNESSAIVPDATVLIMSLKDSSLVKALITDQQGTTGTDNLKEGSYYVMVTHAGYKKYSGNSFLLNATRPSEDIAITLSLKEEANLKAVVVTAKKPFIERQFDKLVVNVESSITATGSSAFEILERSPGVIIDQNDNISMKGKPGVIIMIDGKVTALSGADLANMLRALPSNSIDKIELITNPSARYDAAGTAGIINIRMKKDQRTGTNGNLALGGGNGKYWRYNGGISLNHRNKKINVFGNYNYNERKLYNELSIVRRFFNAETDTMTGGFNQFSVMHFMAKTHVARAGIDFFPSKNTTIGIVVNSLFNNLDRNINNQAQALNYKEQVDSFFTTLNHSEEHFKTYGINVNLRHSFDSLGKELSLDLDYATYANHLSPKLATTYYDLAGNRKDNPYILDGNMQGKLNIYSIKADYIHPLKNKAKFEVGIKSSYVKADNDLVFYQLLNNYPNYDSGKSNHFIYDENINSLYLNFNKSIKNWDLQFGLRAEQTNIKGLQIATNRGFDSSYLKIFPSATLAYTLKNKDILGISVSRRIGRPGYNDLNPFKYYIDPTSYREGNPALQPQFSYAYELNYTHGQTILTASYSRTSNNLTWVIFPERDGDKIYSVETTRNLSVLHSYGVSVSSPLKVTKWWNTQNNIDLYYNKYIGNLSNTPLSNGSPVLNLSSNHSLSLKNGFSGEISIAYQAKQRYGYSISKSETHIAAGIQKSILAKKGTLRFNVTDILHTDYPRITSTFNIYQQYFKAQRNSRVAQLTFTYRFGKNTVPAARRRVSGAEEEKSRAN